MLDSLDAVFGPPKAVIAIDRAWNEDVQEYSYSFVLFQDDFHIVVNAVENSKFGYAYHIFEMDMLFADGRLVLNDISRQLEAKSVIDYDYPGVRVLNDRHPERYETGYRQSMVSAVQYVSKVARGFPHNVNTPETTARLMQIANAIIKSHEHGERIELG